MLRRMALILGLLAIGAPVQAKLYKCQDAEGNTIYTDQPCGDGKELKLPPIQTYTPQPLPFNPGTSAPAEETAVYTLLAITKPANDEVIPDNTGDGRVDIVINIEPELDQKNGDRLMLSVDGTRLKAKGVTTQVRIDNLTPGAHKVQALVVNKVDRVLIESSAVTFYIKRKSVLQPETLGGQKATGAPGVQRTPALIPPPPPPSAP